MKKVINWPEYPCKRCGTVDHWDVRRCINGGGHITYLFVCAACETRTTRFVSKEAVLASGLEVDDIEPTQPRERCAVCGAEGAENHHWAPWALFGSEANSWPRSYLCPRCHKRWHDIVTPDISTRRGL